MISPLTCMAVAVYFEARGESPAQQLMVANTIINRVESRRFPNDVCSVVMQKHQFSFYWDDQPDIVTDQEAWRMSEKWAKISLESRPVYHGGCHYAHKNIDKYWMKGLNRVVHGNHAFYEGGC